MRCKDFREHVDELWEGTQGPELQSHLAQCADCSRYFRDVQFVRAGIRVLKLESAPAPSLGFSERLVRRLGDLGGVPSAGEFFEAIGRRFVYATLVLAFAMLLALVLPATGPVRGVSAESLLPAQETAQLQDPLGETSQSDVPDALPADVSAAPATKGTK